MNNCNSEKQHCVGRKPQQCPSILPGLYYIIPMLSEQAYTTYQETWLALCFALFGYLTHIQCTPDISQSCVSRNWIYRGRMLDPIFWRPRTRYFWQNRGNSLHPIRGRQFFAKFANVCPYAFLYIFQFLTCALHCINTCMCTKNSTK